MVLSEKMATFANVIELKRHIEILLLSNDCVIVPEFGGFMAHHVDARYDGRDSMFLPPLRTIGFNPQLTMNDSLLALSYVEAYDISYPEALNRIADEVAEIKQTLENTGRFELTDIGTIILNETGNYAFEPCEAGILTPELYGLGGFDMLPLAQITNTEAAEHATVVKMPAEENKPAQKRTCIDNKEETNIISANNSIFINEDEEEESSSTEFISIRKSWLRNIAAACIAIIAFFTLSTPLGTSNLQKSQIDTGMLTKVMPKELTQPVHELVLTNNAQPAETPAENISNMPQDRELEAPSSTYYCIVLASRITKRNAATYTEYLQNKGFKEARVLITDTNVKVIYGSYSTENEAYTALNRLHSYEEFTDGWITKVKE